MVSPDAGPPPPGRSRLLVVSHPAVVAANQSVYAVLLQHGWDVSLVVPSRWRHEYAVGDFPPGTLPDLEDRTLPLPVLLPGRPQRYVYRRRLTGLLKALEPDVAFLEEESFSLAALQWSAALSNAGIPFGVQSDENLDRKLHPVARVAERFTVGRAAFVAARSPRAESLIRQRRRPADVHVIPHAVPRWEVDERRGGDNRPFTVGYAGRLIPEKGLDDLVAAVRLLDEPAKLLVVGDGAMRCDLEQSDLGAHRLEVRSDVTHEQMAQAYAEMDVLVLPSRTTPTWAEQFGRVLVEALWCGVPVIGSDSGEIPWVIETTGGGLVFAEGDAGALADCIRRLRGDDALRRRCADEGRAQVAARFGVDAVGETLGAALRAALGLS